MARKKIEDGSIEAQKKLDINRRIKIIRQTFFDDNNRDFSSAIGVNEQTLSQICSGNRNAGIEVVKKIVENIPDINANWIISGTGPISRNEQSVGNITDSSVAGVNVNGENIYIQDVKDLVRVIESYQKTVEKHQEQVDRLITIIEKKI